MLALRPAYLILLVVLLSLVEALPPCPKLKNLPIDKETQRFIDSLNAVKKGVDRLKTLKNTPADRKTLLDVGSDAYCQLVALSFSRQRVITLVGEPVASLMHKYTDKPFDELNKAFLEFQNLQVVAAIQHAKDFAVDMSKLIEDIRKRKILQTALIMIILMNRCVLPST
ncbi:uncharacterized protein MELLADRAFT_101417 [Melampsora larici-populina 98AG31]|uniref:Secreted protein n=1 Tax=Melampsora larici-populina (strain 98AG31 / pathotype 3-4-7) TaxID=747676 RepID=F4R4P1_MELLP|nr:uncharacterized protein MELLADRAFT_101417 [Melampsora larici-populina 98AG31]EGG12966.1 hypothetical protein MELLADRAFT_101417 [Melampsora larici-populina 98AG31]